MQHSQGYTLFLPADHKSSQRVFNPLLHITNVASCHVCLLTKRTHRQHHRRAEKRPQFTLCMSACFETVHLPNSHLRRWLERIPVNPVVPLDLHHHVRSLFLRPTAASASFCIPETLVGHLSSFTQVSKLIIMSSFCGEWTDAFSDRNTVTKYFGGLRQSLQALELTRVYLDMVALIAFFDLFPQS